jgi:hypothetical protein
MSDTWTIPAHHSSVQFTIRGPHPCLTVIFEGGGLVPGYEGARQPGQAELEALLRPRLAGHQAVARYRDLADKVKALEGDLAAAGRRVERARLNREDALAAPRGPNYATNLARADKSITSTEGEREPIARALDVLRKEISGARAAAEAALRAVLQPATVEVFEQLQAERRRVELEITEAISNKLTRLVELVLGGRHAMATADTLQVVFGPLLAEALESPAVEATAG